RNLQRAQPTCSTSERISRTKLPETGYSLWTDRIENLNIKDLATGMLAKSVNNPGHSSFITKLIYIAAEAGGWSCSVESRTRGTLKRCVCGEQNPKTLNHRWHYG